VELTKALPIREEFCLGARINLLVRFRLLLEEQDMFVGLGVVGCVCDPPFKKEVEPLASESDKTPALTVPLKRFGFKFFKLPLYSAAGLVIPFL